MTKTDYHAFIFISFLVGLAFGILIGMGIGRSTVHNWWRNLLVDNPKAVNAIRVQVISEREAYQALHPGVTDVE